MRSFKIYGIWPQASKQASKQADIHRTFTNAVTLVCGSLRLAPINLTVWHEKQQACLVSTHLLRLAYWFVEAQAVFQLTFVD